MYLGGFVFLKNLAQESVFFELSSDLGTWHLELSSSSVVVLPSAAVYSSRGVFILIKFTSILRQSEKTALKYTHCVCEGLNG